MSAADHEAAVREALEMLVGRNDRFRTRRTEALAALDALVGLLQQAEQEAEGSQRDADRWAHIAAADSAKAAEAVARAERAEQQLEQAHSGYRETLDAIAGRVKELETELGRAAVLVERAEQERDEAQRELAEAHGINTTRPPEAAFDAARELHGIPTYAEVEAERDESRKDHYDEIERVRVLEEALREIAEPQKWTLAHGAPFEVARRALAAVAPPEEVSEPGEADTDVAASGDAQGRKASGSLTSPAAAPQETCTCQGVQSQYGYVVSHAADCAFNPAAAPPSEPPEGQT